MLDRLFLSGAADIEYVGSVTKSVNDATGFDTPGEALDVLSIAQTGDLVVIAFTSDSGDSLSWSWLGMNFSQILNATSSENPCAYAGYRFIQSGDTNPYLDNVDSGNFIDMSVVASVFRNASSYSSGAAAAGSTGMPNPPNLTTTGALWVATGHIDDDIVTNWTAPANYTLAAYETNGSSGVGSSTAIAYRISILTSDNPAAFGGSGSDEWRASTSAYL